MAQFDVYPNPVGAMIATVPFVMDVQNDLLADLPTRVVVPLARPSDTMRPTRRLNPVVEIEGEQLIMLADLTTSLPASVLRGRICSLEHHRDDIIAALDFLFTGI